MPRDYKISLDDILEAVMTVPLRIRAFDIPTEPLAHDPGTSPRSPSEALSVAAPRPAPSPRVIVRDRPDEFGMAYLTFNQSLSWPRLPRD